MSRAPAPSLAASRAFGRASAAQWTFPTTPSVRRSSWGDLAGRSGACRTVSSSSSAAAAEKNCCSCSATSVPVAAENCSCFAKSAPMTAAVAIAVREEVRRWLM